MAAAATTEAAFLQRLRSRDPEALSQAVHENARPLFRAARGMGFTAEDAEDVVQDVFVTLLRRADSFEGRSQLRTWLFGILHRKALESRRAAAHDLAASDPIDETFESRFNLNGSWLRPPADIEELMQSAEIGAMISRCMEGLGPLQREVFVLREVQGFTTTEICGMLALTAGNVGVLIHRARVRLRECLEARGLCR